MSIEDDARAVIISMLQHKQREHGVFSTSPYNEVVKGHYWLAKLWDDEALFIPTSHAQPRDAATSVFYFVLFKMCGLERDADLPIESTYHRRLLGPLGLAALRASLTTTTVGD